MLNPTMLSRRGEREGGGGGGGGGEREKIVLKLVKVT